MKRILTICLTLLAVAAMSAATRQVVVKGANHTLGVSSGLKATVVPSAETKVVITGPEEVIDQVDVTSKDGVLTVGAKGVTVVGNVSNVKVDGNLVIGGSGNFRNGHIFDDVKVTVYTPSLSGYIATSSAKITLDSRMADQGEKLMLQASSSGEIAVPAVKCVTLAITATSSGDVKVNDADVSTVSVAASSSADVELKKVKAVTATVSATSSADVEIDSLDGDVLTLTASSSADVEVSSAVLSVLTVTASSSAEVEVGGKAGTASVVASSEADVRIGKLSCSSINRTKSSGGKIR